MHRLKAQLENIYNMDEKGFLLGLALKVRVICHRGRRNPWYSQDENWEMVTVVQCVSAAGRVLPPMYIYKGSAHLMGWHVGVEVKEEATFAWSPKRWTDQQLGLEWLEKNFEKHSEDM